MLLVDAKCAILPGRQDDFIRETRKIIPKVQKEAGCTRYELFTDVGGVGVFHFIEEWESQKHLDKHLVQTHMLEYFSKTAPWHNAPTELTIYEVLASRSVTTSD
jgi:quinol monooxygenase YgiN